MVIYWENDRGLEGFCLFGGEEGVGHDDDRIAYVHQMRRGAVDADAARVAFAGNDVGLQARAVVVVHYLYALPGVNIRRFHKRLIDGDGTDVVQVRLGHLYPMNLRFEYV